MSKIISKLWNGRKVLSEQTFSKPEGETFGAMYAAQRWLRANGYSWGSTDSDRKSGGSNPVRILKGDWTLPQKWHNFTKEDKQKCDGVMIAYDWREGDVRVILFAEKTLL
jgi:hypothetical protein